MAASLPCELNKFAAHTQRLREILSDTKRCFNDINISGRFDGTQIITAELLREEEAEVVGTTEKPPCIVLFGQSASAKGRAINELFNRNILPAFGEADNAASFRMVRFKYGSSPSVSLSLPDDYSLVHVMEAYKGPWQCIPRGDLELSEDEKYDHAKGSAVLDVTLNHPLLRTGAQVVMSPCNHGGDAEEVIKACLQGVSAILMYAFSSEQLTKKHLSELAVLRKIVPCQPVLFINITTNNSKPSGRTGENVPVSPTSPNHSTPRESNHTRTEVFKAPSVSPEKTQKDRKKLAVCKHLCDLGFLNSANNPLQKHLSADYFKVDSDLVDMVEQFPPAAMLFVRHVLQSYLINAATVLNNTHNRCLQMFIISAFDMARDMLITPRKLEFAREKEDELYRTFLQMAISKHDEIRNLISDTIEFMRSDILVKTEEYDFIGVDVPENGAIQTARDLKICTGQIQELVLGSLNHAVANKLVNSVDILRDTYTGTLTRCLESLEKIDKEHPEGASATEALKQILNTAYQVEINHNSSSSLIRVLLEKMKQLVQSMPWKTPPKVDNEWKKKVATDMLASLSASRLAKSISSQIKDRLSKSHESFATALKMLESRHSGRLDKIEEERLKMRKIHAPRVAKLALESTSLRDVVLHGMPQMGREIGRGQYGVVYACETWSTYSPCAVKSVVPPDDKHWNDLALEFYYTKNVPDHERIVALRGSVIDYMYGGGTSPAVLLVMDRLQKDLYGAIKQGLDWTSRLQVAIDVVEGMRFLHSQGLVHRDIKLKNVLLDRHNRGRITDLGFCKPEAMMSGSIVGTPIHMAPELFTGKYDCSVDVYAFGILFWYVCAGHVRLPSAFEQCANKDQLWQSVKKGLRPEKLTQFDEECWLLMQACWEGDPEVRPLLGDVETQLRAILQRFTRHTPNTKKSDLRSSVQRGMRPE
ncbi:dual serine/threonine and tyrosine protein kinase-like [Liolophura sinensis]|uniref:dual serine/threonine and tyrosine protein kinase-like n=1 Tax=Liolophura sinensis TaxID=3198878 RepID=UPI0031591A4C